MRKKIIVGNWKMNNDVAKSTNFAKELDTNINKELCCDVAICPTYIALKDVKEILYMSNIKVGAQNVYFEDSGAYTGEISAEMLKNIGIDYCIIGHSERREYFNETDESVNKKAKKLLEKDIIPIICVGEKKEQREKGTYLSLVKNQVVQALNGISENDVIKVIIAYEPIWAIGTGLTATSEQAEEMCKYIRQLITELYNENVGKNIRILYGGSVNVKNSQELLNQPNVDGALVGGASLKLDFIDIINSVNSK